MITRLRRAWERRTTPSANGGLRFDRPLLLLQSDDWGRIGVRDREGWEELRADGIALGEKPYDFYSLETAEDVQSLNALLKKHRDSVGRSPAMAMNFVMANVDFALSLDSPVGAVSLVPLTDGLPGQWRRPRLSDAYREGIQDGVFFPALHGLTHFCSRAVTRELGAGGENAQLIRKMWRAQTPYIYWRMPWIGYECWDPAPKLELRFLALDDQRLSVLKAAEIYRDLFASAPFSACAPGYRANADTRTAWFEAGVRVVQNGPAQSKVPYLDPHGMLHTFRNVEIEPAIAAPDVESLAREAEQCFRSGLPVVVSIHSINFHSTIRDYRTATLAVLDEFLGGIEKRWPNLLYVHDADLFRIAMEGSYTANGMTVSVGATNAGARK
jgi:hypothetical protein